MKNILIAAVVIAILALAGFFVYSNTRDNSMTSEDNSMQMESDVMKEDNAMDETMMDDNDSMHQGAYVDYSDEAYAKASSKKRVLYFHANWCPICRPTDAEFKKRINEIPEDIVILKVDYDTATELKEKYGITYQHTFVQVDENGNEITKWNGGMLDELISRVK